MWFLYSLIDLSVTSGNCGAQQYYCCAECSSEMWVSTRKSLYKSTRFLAQCCVQNSLRQVHLFMASWGPLAAELRCETPLHPLTLAVKHHGKSNALHRHASTLHHMFLSEVKQWDKRLAYLINSPHRAPSTSARWAQTDLQCVCLNTVGLQKLQSEIRSLICTGKFR